MAYEHVHKSFGQSSLKKKHTPIVPPLIEQQTPADSHLSPLVKLSKIPSKEEREAIKRKIFETLDRTGENQAMRSGLYNPIVRERKTSDASTIGLPIQAKLTIGEPGDKYEQEADKVASQVVNLINAPVAQQSAQNLQREETSTDDELQMKSVADTIQLHDLLEVEEELPMKPMVQLQSSAGGLTATPEVETSIQQARGGGQSLADNIRQPMEQAFGSDFSGVKVHTDTQADQLNQSIQARAFTTGQDVFFRSGEYNPGSLGGQELLAHELTHVVQQGGGTVKRKPLPQPQLSQHPVTKAPLTSGKIQAMQNSEGEASSGPVEAGETPILKRKEGGGKAEFTIKGLINCVGVVIKVYQPNGGQDHIAAVGGHFVTPTMFDTQKNDFTGKGSEFIKKIKDLIQEFPKGDLEAEFHVKEAAVKGTTTTSGKEAKQAANAIKAALGIGGGIHQSSDNVTITI